MTDAEADELLAEIVEIRRHLQAARDDVAVIEQALGIIPAERAQLQVIDGGGEFDKNAEPVPS